MIEPSLPSPMTRNLIRYFSRYPDRGGAVSSRLFRRGERERFDVLREWMPDCDGRTVLDAGCGDGAFLRRLLRGHPLRLRLEDIVAEWTNIARDRLRDCADTIETACADVHDAGDPERYDIVLALGVFDYASDWIRLRDVLLSRTRGTLFIDCPKKGTLHSWIRRAWLRTHGLRLHMASRRDVTALASVPGTTTEIVELPLQWVVRLDRTGR